MSCEAARTDMRQSRDQIYTLRCETMRLYPFKGTSTHGKQSHWLPERIDVCTPGSAPSCTQISGWLCSGGLKRLPRSLYLDVRGTSPVDAAFVLWMSKLVQLTSDLFDNSMQARVSAFNRCKRSC
jgi:hypothetical protein